MPVLLPDGKVYFFGDMFRKEVFKIYDSKLNKFYPIANMKPESRNITATLLPDNTVLITGGFSPNKKYDAKLYNPSLNKYIHISIMNAKRAGHTATLLKNEKVLIVGGNDKNEPYAELYDYKTGKFFPLKNYKTRSLHTATLLSDGRVLIIGGLNRFASPEGFIDTNEDKTPLKEYSDIEIYNPKTNEFIEIGHLNCTRFDHSSVLLKSKKVFITGGYGHNNLVPINWTIFLGF